MSRRLGNIAEDKATQYLDSEGFEIIERNYFARVGEIDIIASKGDTLHFIEVKSRKSSKYGSACEMLTTSKMTKLLAAARYYQSQNSITTESIQFDLVAIEDGGEPIFYENVYVEGM